MHFRVCNFSHGYFTVFRNEFSGNFLNAHGNQQNQVSGKRKYCKINDRAERERNNGLNIGINGKCTLEIRADVEHIKGFFQFASMRNFIQEHGNSHCASKNGHCLEHGFVLKLHVTAVKQINCN